MAVPARSGKFHFLVLFLIISSSCLQVHCIQEFIVTCGTTIDLVMNTNIQSGLLTMAMPDSMDMYQNPARQLFCDVNIMFTSGMNLLVELYYLDIMPKSGDITVCSTGLDIFDSANRKYYGGRICMEAWQWEERHREKQQEKVEVLSSPLTLRLSSEAPYRGGGFKLHFNQYRPYWPCYTREFKCREKQRCVHDDLTCDSWDDCADYSDERIEAGCHLLTASEICALIMGIILILGTIAGIVVYIVSYRRLSQEYGVRSESKIPIADNEKYNMEPVFGIGRRYNSQDSIPSRYSRSTAATMARRDSDSDIVNKADLEKADRQKLLLPLTGTRMSNKTVDNMSEKSYRSNPRKAVVQSLAAEVPSQPIAKSGQYSYGSRKGLGGSQSSLNGEKFVALDGIEKKSADRNSIAKERLGSRERLSDKNRERYSRDRYSDSDGDYDRDDRRRRISKDRDRRRTDRYSDDDDSDYDREKGYRRRRRSYDRYSDDSDYEYERDRDKRRRSRDRYSRERYDDSDVDGDLGKDSEKDRSRSSYHRGGSRERGRDRYDDEDDTDKGRRRDRDRYSRDRYDDEDDTDKGRGRDRDRSSRDRYDDEDDADKGRGQDSDKDMDRPRNRRDSRDRDRYRDSYDEDRGPRRSKYDDDSDDYDDRSARRRSKERRRGASSERDRIRSRSREDIAAREKDRKSPSLPMPPPYSERDAEQPHEDEPAFVESKRYMPQNQPPPPPPTDVTLRSEQQYPSTEDLKRTERASKPPPFEERYREPQIPKPTPPEVRYREPRNQKFSLPEAEVSRPEQQSQKSPPKEINETDRRRNTDDRKERYSRSRWTPKKKTDDLPPPDYEDVAPPKSTFVGISYKEESV